MPSLSFPINFDLDYIYCFRRIVYCILYGMVFIYAYFPGYAILDINAEHNLHGKIVFVHFSTRYSKSVSVRNVSKGSISLCY